MSANSHNFANQPNKQLQNAPSVGSDGSLRPVMALKDTRDPSMVLKRSFSTPAVRSMAQDTAQQGAASSNEKKRNKLGYHRTSIACTHCRRRKIRCIVSTDVQNRCVNCIRLKKDCSFYPVDQQPTPDSKSKAPSQATSNSGLTSQSPSPALAPGHMAEMPSTAAFATRPQQQPVSTSGPTVPSSSNAHSNLAGRATSTAFSTDNPFYIPTQADLPWSSAEPSPAMMPNSAGLGMGWGSFSSEPSGSSEYAAYTHGPGVGMPQQWPQANMGTAPQPDWAWQSVPPTTRSMSFSGESMAHPQQQPMLHMAGSPYQDMNDMSNLFAAQPMRPQAESAALQADPSSMSGIPWQTGQTAPQQMVLQHRQQNVYRQQQPNFDNWVFPDSGGGQAM